ncbi:MAG: hypothetical protein ABFD66_07725 [Smithella sp.]
MIRNVKFRPFLIILLVFSGVVWFAALTVSGGDAQELFEFMRPLPTVVTADGFLILIFMKWAWRWKWLQDWLVPVPDLNGTWQGTILTSWKDSAGNTPGPIPAILTIKQTFLHASCVMRTAEMESHSYVEGFHIDKERQIRRLCYSYISKPKTSLRDRSSPHDGTILFNIVGKPARKLEGEYWTQRKTTGVIILTLKTSQLYDELPADFPTHPMMPQTTKP